MRPRLTNNFVVQIMMMRQFIMPILPTMQLFFTHILIAKYLAIV